MLSVHGVCAYTALYIVCGVALAALLRWRSVRRTLVASAHLPSPPKPHFFMGHLLEWFIVNGARKHDWATEMLRHLKAPTMFIRSVPIGPTGHRIVTTDPAVVKHILADKFDRYVKKLDYIFGFRALLGDGIFSIDHGPHAADGGAAWRRQRKLAARIFTVNNFKASMCDAFRRNAAAVQAVLARRAGAPVDIQDLWFRFTMDSIGELGFGVQMGTLQEAMGGGGGGGGTARGLLFARAFDSAHRRMLSFKHSLLTLLSIDLLPPPFRQLGRAVFSRLNGNAVGFFADIAALDSFSYKLIRQRRAEGAAALDAKGDLLALFMRAPLDEGEPAVSDRELRDVVMSFIIAGRDTTACLLSWATLLLCQHPRIAAKLRAEIAEALPGGAQPDFLSVKKMPYLVRGDLLPPLLLPAPPLLLLLLLLLLPLPLVRCSCVSSTAPDCSRSAAAVVFRRRLC